MDVAHTKNHGTTATSQGYSSVTVALHAEPKNHGSMLFPKKNYGE